MIDSEVVILGVDGYPDFNALHSGKHNEEVQLCAFDVLAMDGDDLRKLPLSMRKANLARLLARWPDGTFLSDFEQAEIGPDLFVAACQMPGEQASRSALSGWYVEALGQGQEPEASRDGAGDGGACLMSADKHSRR